MRRALLLLGILVVGCDGPPNATAPSPVPPATIPATITITAVPAVGVNAGEVYVAAHVVAADGRPVGSTLVTFSTSAGVVQPAAVLADSLGLAQATVKTSTPAIVRAVAGSAAAVIDVTPVAPLPTPTPPVPPVPTPTPPPGSGPFTITLVATPATAGSETIFSLVGQGSVTSATWTFGDGSGATTSTPYVRHVYAAAGTYAASVSASDASGRSASSATSVTISAAPPTTAPPAAAGLTLSLSCTPAAHASATVCNVAAAYNGAAVPSTSITKVDWDWGDGTSLIVNNSPLGTRTYPQAGSYLVVAYVTVTTVDGSRQSTTSQLLQIP